MQEIQETRVRSLGWEDLLEKAMATHSNTLAWEIPWTEERRATVHSVRVRYDRSNLVCTQHVCNAYKDRLMLNISENALTSTVQQNTYGKM